ncbi:hypothetical protein OSB04_022202 [Centaurea solstitialis]|uniref:Uncharacterized protein n=1 Tax=Centaurea solstitialis TaxID=347529 RepID=A0AA38SVP5_9ASTR|nr:hypothetical protein OSB04_022202 [Centaurea solstitialis]
MMQEKGSKGSEHRPKRSVSYQEQPEKEQKQPFKKRARFLYSDDIKEVSLSENSGATNDSQRSSSTSGLKDTTEEIKPEITPIKNISYDRIYRKEVLVASLSQLAIREGDHYEEGQKASMEDGGDGNNSHNTAGENEQNKGGKKLVEHVTSTIIHDVGSKGRTHENELDCSAIVPNVDSRHTNANREGDHHEQDHVVEDVGNENGSESAIGGEQNLKGNVPNVVDDGKQVPHVFTITNLEENKKCSPAGTTIKSRNDVDSEGAGHGREQHVAMEDVCDGNDSKIAIRREKQSKQGKQPVEYVVSTMVHDGYKASNIGEKGHEGGNASSVVGDGELPPSIDLTVERRGGAHVALGNLGRGIDNNTFTSIENMPSDIGSSDVYSLAQGGSDRQRQHDQNWKRNRISHELRELAQGESGGDESREQARKKFKYGNDEVSESSSSQGPSGGTGYDEQMSLLQHANHTFRLFGVDIPYEEQHFAPNTEDNAGGNYNVVTGLVVDDGSSSMQQPTFVFRLFGIDIPVEHIPPVAMGIEDGGNNNNLVLGSNNGHGSGELSMQQPPKAGFRLFGFDI